MHPSPKPVMDVQIRKLDPVRVAFVRNIGPYAACCSAWQKLIAWAGPRGLLTTNAICLGVGHDNPAVTEPSRLRYDACFVITDETRVDGEIGVQVLPGGDYAVTVHHGPYEQLPRVYAELFGQWLPRLGRQLGRGAPYEIYRNNPQTSLPQNLITEIRIPLA